MTRRAILWLSGQRGKAILKLTDDDYNEEGLQDLLRAHGSAYEANRAGFYQMQHTITGWPADAIRVARCRAMRPCARSAPPRPGYFPSAYSCSRRTRMTTSISMGGTLCRLVEHGHEVHIAYQVSGANAVSDEALWRVLQFARDAGLGGGERAAQLADWCEVYENTGVFPAEPELRRWKGLVRRHEAAAAARVCGVPPERLQFSRPAFLRRIGSPARRGRCGAGAGVCSRGCVRIWSTRRAISPTRTARIASACARCARRWLPVRRTHGSPRPSSGSTAAPGPVGRWTNRSCRAAQPAGSPAPRRAIFRHETQKDQALFPGDDRREFWQRTEDRSRSLATAYNTLGLAEYEAIEAFKRYTPEEFIRHVQL